MEKPTIPMRTTSEAGSPARPANQLLAEMPANEFARIEPHLTQVMLQTRDLLFDINQPIEFVYFPETCVASIVAVMSDGAAVETATIGHEGMVGMPIFHGTDRTSAQAFCQVPGHAWKLPADVFRREVLRAERFSLMLHRYSQALFTLVSQSSACNRLHTMRQRCARWVLHTCDRVSSESDECRFPLTQQFLSQMLGVRRATVTEAMSMLQESGSVTYHMGVITLRNRAQLEDQACECYRIVRSEFDRLLAVTRRIGQQTPSPLDRLAASEGGKSTIGDAVSGDSENSREE